jgi:2,4-dienoyl-CoA reductase-like NADH-dependent reductase (Old Yellow Enzyme family)
MATSKLFQPIQVGRVTLQHRVVMAPLTRYRGNSRHTPTDLLVEHYAARGSLPGTLIISEATFIAHKASGYSFHVPGIWSDEQVAAWKKVCSFPRHSPQHAVLNALYVPGDGCRARKRVIYVLAALGTGTCGIC